MFVRFSFPGRHLPLNVARFKKVQFQDAAIELLERGTGYTADSAGVGSIGSEAEAIRQSQQMARSIFALLDGRRVVGRVCNR